MVTVLVSSRFRHNLEISDHHAESLMTHSHQPGLAKCQKWYRIGEGMRIDSTEFMMSHGKTSSAIYRHMIILRICPQAPGRLGLHENIGALVAHPCSNALMSPPTGPPLSLVMLLG
jgi:hypothetical protein